MISDRIQTMINEQYHKELFSSHLYLSMSSWFLARDLDGFANFFRLQADEELMHARKQFDYLHNVDGKMTLGAIGAPRTEWSSNLEVFEDAYLHEQDVTRSINAIVKATLESGDFATLQFMQWFVEEQVEEEASIRNIIAKVKLAGDNNSALFLLNEELGRRQPAANAEA